MPGSNLVRGLAAGVGLASESITAYRAKRRQEQQPQESDNTNTQQQDPMVEADTDEDWELDEAQDVYQPMPREKDPNQETTTTNIQELVNRFAHAYPLPSLVPTSAKLPYPVILPQRRPGSRQRGFIKAYAPVLQDVGIDQTMFLDFLETANRAGRASPWLNAINLASLGAMALPEAISLAVSIAVQKMTNALIEVEGRRQTNNFFDKINEAVFRPRGLYCLIMTYQPESSSASVCVDLNSTVSKSIDQGEAEAGFIKKNRHRFKASDGETCEIPESAPLIFPGLDELQDQDSNYARTQPEGRREFIANYLDRRAQAEFAMENPDNALTQAPPPTFTSRYADPSHPANSGSLIALATGVHITADNIRRRGRGRRLRPERGHGGTGPLGRLRERREQRRAGGILTGVKKILKSGVLYLMVVNMPSDEEMIAAREMLGS